MNKLNNLNKINKLNQINKIKQDRETKHDNQEKQGKLDKQETKLTDRQMDKWTEGHRDPIRFDPDFDATHPQLV